MNVFRALTICKKCKSMAINSGSFLFWFDFRYGTHETKINCMEIESNLSKQELKMLKALSDGKLYKEIAADYGISVNTVKKHLKNVYKKLGVTSRTEAAQKYSEVFSPALDKAS